MEHGMIRKYMEERYRLMSELIRKGEIRLRELPEGRLKIRRSGSHTYYYRSGSGRTGGEKILGGEEDKLIRNLAQKTYLENIVKTAKEEQAALKKALDSYPQLLPEQIYGTLPEERQALINPIVPTDEEFVRQWLAIPFKPKEIKEGTAFYVTMKGERVRSKSEQIIADRLFAKGIPYKYECPLKVGRETYHPDFTILRLSDRQEIYYEHIGKLDDPQYVNDNAPKYNAYYRNGILPGVKLFMTFETSEYPLDMRALDKVIEEQFR